MPNSTPGVREEFDPREGVAHRYGLSTDRWARLRHRSYWLTGAGTGFGRAMGIALASAGAQIFLTGRREAKLHETIEAIGSLGVAVDRCHAVPADLSDLYQIQRASEYVRANCPSLQGLVHSAAMPQRIDHRYPLQEETPEYWDEIMWVNVKAPWYLTKTILPHMVCGGEIKVLFLSSAAGWSFASGYGHYNISKAALNSLTACFAEECKARNPAVDVQINALDPGQARTEMNPGSTRSPFGTASMGLVLLSHPEPGPNGKFFCHDGSHRDFCNSAPYERSLLADQGPPHADERGQGRQ
jgi:NAD(P)-dependent dehydrogenase (short-subunit alcohol dehydrogenase family)